MLVDELPLRSTLELLQFISISGISAMRWMIDGTWSGEYGNRAAAMTPEDFPTAVDQQMNELPCATE